VKFLVDTNLPSRLCVWLRSHRHEAEHLVDLNLLTATDTQIWQRGRSENLVIFSKDVDFYDRALIFGTPPQVVHVEVGNCSNTRLFELLASEWDHIEQALLSGSRLISITLDIAPYPSRRRNSTHDRMLCLMEVLARMLARRGIATANVAARLALAKSYPKRSLNQALFTRVGSSLRGKVLWG
jgi:predicted nuclease of predicted toxin-antitoxin system